MHHKSNRYDIGNKTEWEERKVKVHFQFYSSTLYIIHPSYYLLLFCIEDIISQGLVSNLNLRT